MMEKIWVKYLNLWKNVVFLTQSKLAENQKKLLVGVYNLIQIKDQQLYNFLIR